MACKVSLQSLLATLIAISVANNGNGSAQVAGRCIAYVRPATRIPSALLHVVPMPAWEQRKFVDFVEASGIRNKDNLQLESYSVSNDRGFVPQDEQFENGGTMRDADKTAYWIVEPGSFAYNPARINVGSIGYQSTRKNVIVSSLYEVFKTDRSCDDRFLWHWFKSSLFTKQIEMLQEGGVRLYFFFDKLQKSEIWMPNVDEQRIIGQQFDQLDSLITLHQRKYDKLVILKKSMLEKMFPKDGESVPEIRFAGFTDPWEQRKLGELALTYSGGTPSAGNSAYYGGEIPFIRSAEIDCDSTELSLTVAGLNNSSAKLVDKGMVLYAMYGATSGEVAISKIKGAINQAILAMDASDMAANRFIAYWLRRQKKSITETFLQGGQGNLSGAIIKELGIPQPSLDEQRQIGSFFSNLDDLITLHQRKRLSIRQRSPVWS